MVDAVGDVILAPGSPARIGPTTDVELLSSTNPGSYLQRGVTLKVGQGYLPVGAPLKKDSGTNYYVVDTANSTAVEGFLRYAANTGVTGDIPKAANIVTRGTLKYSVVKAALLSLNAVSSGSGLTSGAISTLNGRVDTVRDEFIF
jgi:hypothetical protein